MEFLLFLAVCLLTGNGEVLAQYDDWVEYKDEIHIKVFDDLLTFDEAKAFCSMQGNGASMAMIKESDMQGLLAIYTGDIIDNIWIGAKYDDESAEFKWVDGDSLSYTNWQAGFPKPVTNGDACIEMRQLVYARTHSSGIGEWAHVTCRKRNLPLCQVKVPWTLEQAVAEIIQVRKQLEATQVKLEFAEAQITNSAEKIATAETKIATAETKIATAETKIATAETKIATAETKIATAERKIATAETKITSAESQLVDIRSKTVPVGSIYIEYSSQSPPRTLWPSFTWQDVTSSYAGMFFRAYGGDSASWGVTQSACAPRITQMSYQSKYGLYQFPDTLSIPASGWSVFGRAGEYYYPGNYNTLSREGLRFFTETCEVRPRNRAIRIWKRIA